MTDMLIAEVSVASIRALGPIYALVNNAALADGVGGKPFHEIAVEDWDRIVAANALSRSPSSKRQRQSLRRDDCRGKLVMRSRIK